MDIEKLKEHCERTINQLPLREECAEGQKRLKDEHQLILDLIEERGDLHKECDKLQERIFELEDKVEELEGEIVEWKETYERNYRG